MHAPEALDLPGLLEGELHGVNRPSGNNAILGAARRPDRKIKTLSHTAIFHHVVLAGRE